MTCFLAQATDEPLYTILYLYKGNLCYNRRRKGRWSYNIATTLATVTPNPDPVLTPMKVNLLLKFTIDSVPTIDTHPELFI